MAQNIRNNTKGGKQPQGGQGMPLTWDNYKWMLIGLGLIILGFVLMTGSGNDDPAVFNERIFSWRRITLAPIIVLAGFGLEIWAIMKRPREKK